MNKKGKTPVYTGSIQQGKSQPKPKRKTKTDVEELRKDTKSRPTLTVTK